MPRKTGTTVSPMPATPYVLGPKLVDDEGDSVTDPNLDAVRTVPVGVGGVNINTLETLQAESLNELKRIRRASEILIDEEVDVPED